MSTAINAPTASFELLRAEVMPLPESRPESPAGIDAELMNPNDTEEKRNLAGTSFTSEVEGSLSDIPGHGSVNLKFSAMADLFVKATDTEGRAYIFQVYSAALEAASTVFHDMMYTINTRGNKEEWVWELHDSPLGLKVMFSLMHLNYNTALFTQEPGPHQVYEVLRILDKYNVRDEAFYPFARSWIAGFRRGPDASQLTQLERLYTAQKLGDFKTMKICIRRVALQVHISQNGSIFLGGKPIQEVVPITEELLENIRVVRGMDLKNLLGPLKTAYDALMGDTDDHDTVNFCKSVDGHDECNEKFLGSLLGSLRRQKLRPIPTPSTYLGSVGMLADQVARMEIQGLIVPNLEAHKQRHFRCRLGQDEVAKEILECKAYVAIYDDLVEQMVITAKRVGISKDEKDEFEDYKDVFNKASIKYDEEAPKNFWGWNEDM